MKIVFFSATMTVPLQSRDRPVSVLSNDLTLASIILFDFHELLVINLTNHLFVFVQLLNIILSKAYAYLPGV